MIDIKINKNEIVWKDYVFPIIPENRRQEITVSLEDYKILRENFSYIQSILPANIGFRVGIRNNTNYVVSVYKIRKKYTWKRKDTTPEEIDAFIKNIPDLSISKMKKQRVIR